MLKSMLKKELTELSALFLLALAGHTVLVADHVTTAWRRFHPRGDWMLDDDFVYPFLLISLALAIAMGLVQCLSEDIQGTWRYVLSLPGGWRRIIRLKLVCGLIIWVGWAVAAFLVCALGLLAEPGVPGETFGRLSEPTLRILVCVPVVYFGAFLTALRRANWLFSRLMPLGGVLLIWFTFLYLPNWWILAPLATIASMALLAGIVSHVASSRDFA